MQRTDRLVIVHTNPLDLRTQIVDLIPYCPVRYDHLFYGNLLLQYPVPKIL